VVNVSLSGFGGFFFFFSYSISRNIVERMAVKKVTKKNGRQAPVTRAPRRGSGKDVLVLEPKDIAIARASHALRWPRPVYRTIARAEIDAALHVVHTRRSRCRPNFQIDETRRPELR